MPSLPPPSYFLTASGGSCGGSGAGSVAGASVAAATISVDGAGAVEATYCPTGAAAAAAAAASSAVSTGRSGSLSAVESSSSSSSDGFSSDPNNGGGDCGGIGGGERLAAAVWDGEEGDDDRGDDGDPSCAAAAAAAAAPGDVQQQTDEEIARLFAHMEARRHREEETARLDAEAESLRMAMEMQAAEEDERDRRRRESAMEEEEGWRAALALRDEEEDWNLAKRLMREEEEDCAEVARRAEAAAAAAMSMAGDDACIAASRLRAGGDDDDDDAAALAAAVADEADLAAGCVDPVHGVSVSDEAALRLACAIQAQDAMLMRQHDSAASVDLARRLEEQERARRRGGRGKRASETAGSGAGTETTTSTSAAITTTLRRMSSSRGRTMSDPFPSSLMSDIMMGELTRQDSAADLYRAALHHGPLHVRQEEAWSRLTPRQREAVGYVDCVAQSLHEEALPGLRERVRSLGFDLDDLEACLAYIRDDAPIIIHLKERTLEHLCRDPWYRSQFETGTSGGTLDRRRRQRWEDAMFAAAYSDAPDDEHPKYGCLNITGDIRGVRGARGYGKLYLTLAPSVRHRTSFSNKDTGQQAGKSKMATNNWYGHVLAEYSDDELRTVFRVSGVSRLSGAPSSAFSQYKECQIHGTLSMATDVMALSVPARREEASDKLASLVEQFRQISGCTVLWQGDLLGD